MYQREKWMENFSISIFAMHGFVFVFVCVCVHLVLATANYNYCHLFRIDTKVMNHQWHFCFNTSRQQCFFKNKYMHCGVARFLSIKMQNEWNILSRWVRIYMTKQFKNNVIFIQNTNWVFVIVSFPTKFWLFCIKHSDW